MSPPGNLIAPPMVEVCVVADPPEAKITINNAELSSGSCTTIAAYNDQLQISATADGYEPYQKSYAPAPPTDPPTPYNIQLKKIVK